MLDSSSDDDLSPNQLAHNEKIKHQVPQGVKGNLFYNIHNYVEPKSRGEHK